MIDIADGFSAGVIVAAIVCVGIWPWLTARNVINKNYGYAFGCFLMSVAFILTLIQFSLKMCEPGTLPSTISTLRAWKSYLFALGSIQFVYFYKPVKKDN